MRRRNICFVTGTRAEFGLMRKTLRAIADHPQLRLQILATGMHLDHEHGDGLKSIREQGWAIDSVVKWKAGAGRERVAHARNTGLAMAAMASEFARLKSDVVLVVGDRVEAFAAAGAGHISGLVVAQVHGGDRAAGQVDDCLRHAISKISHLHFTGTARSRERLIRMGEDRWRVKCFGSPGIDGIVDDASSGDEVAAVIPGLRRRQFALVVHHPVDANDAIEKRRMTRLLDSVGRSFETVVVIDPNNDPGSAGIRTAIDARKGDQKFTRRRDVRREVFLGLMRDAAVLIGNSSSGIIEAASFGLPVIDIGDRQKGRERGPNVVHTSDNPVAIRKAIQQLGGLPARFAGNNIYGGRNTACRIAAALATVPLDDRLRRKLISY